MSLAVMFCFLFHLLILTSQIAVVDSGIFTTYLCKLRHEVIKAVNNMKKLTKCLSCDIYEKKEELKTAYQEFVNQTLKSVLHYFPFSDKTLLVKDVTESSEEITETTEMPTETTAELETNTITEIEPESTYETETDTYTETDTTDVTETSTKAIMMTMPTTLITSRTTTTVKAKTTPWSVPKPTRIYPITATRSTIMTTPILRFKIVTSPTNISPTKIVTTPKSVWKPKTSKTPSVLVFVSAKPITFTKQTSISAPIKATTPKTFIEPITIKIPKGRIYVLPKPINIETQNTAKVPTTQIKMSTPTTIKIPGVGVFVSPNPIIVTKRTTVKAAPTRTPVTLMTLPTRTTLKTQTKVVMSTTVKIPRTSKTSMLSRTQKTPRITRTSTTPRISRTTTTPRLPRTINIGPSNIVRRMSLPINKYQINNNLSEKILERSIQLDLVKVHGYKAEIHTVVTPDGYLLTLHRIMPKTKYTGRNNNKTVILLHGLLGSSVDWILLGPKHSLPYKLINAGYDVWLPNVRGNAYSRAHVSKSIHSAEFWDFSWHEIGLYDLSSIIDYIRENNSEKGPIIFIAHSMGATALMVLLSTSPHYNTILSFVILLAPLVFMQQAKGPLRLLSEFKSSDHNATVKILGDRSFNPVDSFMRVARKKFCKEDAILCLHPLFLFTDGGRTIKSNGHRKNILTNMRTGGSAKTILHFCQLIKSGQFEMYDLGSTYNLKKYGTVSPPKYHLRDIKLPMALFNSQNDWISTVPDILNLMSQLPNAVTHHVVQLSSTEFNHLDFVLSQNAPKLVYKHVFDILDQLF